MENNKNGWGSVYSSTWNGNTSNSIGWGSIQEIDNGLTAIQIEASL